MVTFPVQNKGGSSETIICLPYDIKKIYAFYCSRYTDISIKEFMSLGYDEFSWKLDNIPESEPLYTIFKSRAIKLSEIKDKEERKYWRKLKRANKIPDIYLSPKELNDRLKENVKNGGIKNAR